MLVLVCMLSGSLQRRFVEFFLSRLPPTKRNPWFVWEW